MEKTTKIKTKDAAFFLAENIAKTKFEDLPDEVVELTKRSILDTLGCILAASGLHSSSKLLVELVRETGGTQESTILGFGGKAPAQLAALANGALAHCLDYDDCHYQAFNHLGASTVPAALATAEKIGSITGKEFICAVALAEDLEGRLGIAADIKWKMRWLMPSILGVFSSAAVAAKLLGLDTAKIVNAFGIAFCQAAGTMEMRFSLANDMGAMRDSFPAQAGVLSALMARKGISGPENSLEGRAGLYPLYFANEYDREALLSDLGKKFEGSRVSFKLWPTCGSTHNYIGATLKLMSKYHIEPTQITEVVVYVGDHTSGLCEPLEGRRQPRDSMDARYSIPFVVAVVLTKGQVKIEHIQNLKDPVVLDMAKKVTYKYDPSFNFISSGEPPGVVEIRTKEGNVYSERHDIPYGDYRNPLSKEDIVNKFRGCSTYSAKSISQKNVEKIIKFIDNLETAKNIKLVAELLA